MTKKICFDGDLLMRKDVIPDANKTSFLSMALRAFRPQRLSNCALSPVKAISYQQHYSRKVRRTIRTQNSEPRIRVTRGSLHRTRELSSLKISPTNIMEYSACFVDYCIYSKALPDSVKLMKRMYFELMLMTY